ncbi:MAG TPA: hypothetical protein VG738_14745 [Chitinophagaceae bacterium]|nr:hypothetical protein [Chitinophagaceae bacterium]
MAQSYHYATVTEALQQLRAQGFTIDFNIEQNCLSSAGGKFSPGDFDIVDVYRYEGNSDPADEATVYAIQSASGIKGVLVTGFGVSAEDVSPEMLKKLHMHTL